MRKRTTNYKLYALLHYTVHTYTHMLIKILLISGAKCI